jgi:hypothetical protein
MPFYALQLSTLNVHFSKTLKRHRNALFVIYNARNAPPVVTIDVNSNQSLVTLKADGAPLAVMSCHSTEVPSAEDVVLVARYAPQNA